MNRPTMSIHGARNVSLKEAWENLHEGIVQVRPNHL